MLNAYLETELEKTFALISVSEADRQTDNKQVRAKESRVRLLNAYVETKLEKTYSLSLVHYEERQRTIHILKHKILDRERGERRQQGWTQPRGTILRGLRCLMTRATLASAPELPRKKVSW